MLPHIQIILIGNHKSGGDQNDEEGEIDKEFFHSNTRLKSGGYYLVIGCINFAEFILNKLN